jgi:two-component system, chemotaxis family, CheB/CheR fusion protein
MHGEPEPPTPGDSEGKHAHYLRTIDDSPLGMFRLDARGRIMDANQRLLDLLGYEWADLKGKSFDDITHPDDRWIALEVLLDLRAGRTDNVAYEKRFLTQRGSSVWAAVTVSAITVSGELVGVVVMLTDLSVVPATNDAADGELELLRTTLSVAPIIVFACDNDGTLILCEDSGLESPLSAGDILGRLVWDVYEDSETVRSHIQLGLEGKSGEFLMRFGGSEFNCRYRPIQALDGTTLGVSGLAQDVTALAQMTSENTRLSEFMAVLSHELRNPLNTIMGFTELLVNGSYGALSDRQRRPLEHIEVGGRQLLSLINDILDLAKVKAGHIHLEDAPLEAGGLIRALAEEMSHAAASKGIQLTEVTAPAISFTADARRVHQVLLNLLSNAVKFTPSGGTVELGFTVDANGGPRMCVTDTGPGLTPDQLRLIFEEYGQVAAHQGGNPTGIGLGLPLSRRLATLMGGTVVAESTVGVGSRFCLVLPRERAMTPV